MWAFFLADDLSFSLMTREASRFPYWVITGNQSKKGSILQNVPMSSIATAVSGRKADRARLSVRIFKCIAYLGCALVAYWFKSKAEYVSGAVTGVMILFAAFELLDVLRVFVSKPIQLSQKQSSLLGATGLDFEVKKTSGIKPKPKMPDLDTSLASCLLNKSIDSPKVRGWHVGKTQKP